MQNYKKIEEDRFLVNTFSEMIQSFEQIYVVKMNNVREKVLGNRRYSDGLSEVYKNIKQEQSRLYLTDKKTKKIEEITENKDKGTKDVAVLLTAKKRLSGDINTRIFNDFVNYINQYPACEIVIVGSSGKTLFEMKYPNRSFTYFSLPDKEISAVDLLDLYKFIFPYRQTVVFYGRYLSLLKQIPTQIYIKVGISDKQNPSQTLAEGNFLIEPSLDVLIEFFETHIFQSLFTQTSHESYLAQTGARISVLQDSGERIKRQLKTLQMLYRKTKKQSQNKKQLQMFSSRKLWHI